MTRRVALFDDAATMVEPVPSTTMLEDNSRTAESATPHLRKGKEPEGFGDWSAPHPGAHAGREG
jgi:hypothetical protein